MKVRDRAFSRIDSRLHAGVCGDRCRAISGRNPRVALRRVVERKAQIRIQGVVTDAEDIACPSLVAVAPIDDEKDVNVRRAALGLMRLELYARLVRVNSPDVCGSSGSQG